MPSPTVEQLQKREASIKKSIAGLGEAPDQLKLRGLRKKLKRTQRRRRLDVVLAVRHAPKPKAEVKAEEPKAEVKAEEPKAEVKAEEPKAEVKAEEPKAEVKAEEPKAEVAAPAEESKKEE